MPSMRVENDAVIKASTRMCFARNNIRIDRYSVASAAIMSQLDGPGERTSQRKVEK
jgi:hypothetical protein